MPRPPEARHGAAILGALAAALLLAVAPDAALAQSRATPTFERLLRDFDANGDGVVGRVEWRGPLARFDELDRDRNHVLTREDIREVRAARRAGVPGVADIVDVVAHLAFPPGGAPAGTTDIDYDSAADQAVATMDANRIAVSMLALPPMAEPGQGDDAVLFAQAARHPGRFGVLGGGATLNPMIQATPADGAMASAEPPVETGPAETAPDQAAPAGEPGQATAPAAPPQDAPAGGTDDVGQAFAAEAKGLIAAGVGGFGEIAVLQFSTAPGRPFQAVPPDHPLLLQLADIAAENGLPIALRMEFVPEDMAVPEEIGRASPENPETVAANLAAFERLLDHNAGARIVLVGATDATGARTAERVGALMEGHPNLYMSLGVDPGAVLARNMPLGARGGVAAEWLKLIADHPDRFMIGSGQYHAPKCAGCATADLLGPSLRWLRFLPPDVARQVGGETPRRVFNLVEGG